MVRTVCGLRQSFKITVVVRKNKGIAFGGIR